METKLKQAILSLIHLVILLFLSCPSVWSETITLKLPRYKDNSHRYYHELLKESLKQIGVDVQISGSEFHLPQKRAVLMVKHGRLDAVWLVESGERNRIYHSAGVGLTDGLIGKRVLFIPKGAQKKFNLVTNLNDFKRLGLYGAFGISWYDVKIWKHNGLLVTTVDGDWQQIYAKVEARLEGYDYFSRGINEIILEAPNHPELEIEQNLLLIYDRDFQLYLGKSGAQHREIIRKALLKSKENGLMERLIRKHWSDVYSEMLPDKRQVIRLELPEP